jgi:hypothetical protein
VDATGVAVDADVLFEEGGKPIGVEVVGIGVSEADCGDVGEASTGGLESLFPGDECGYIGGLGKQEEKQVEG